MRYNHIHGLTKLVRRVKRRTARYPLLQYLVNQRSRREVLKFYGQFINQGDLCFDVGQMLEIGRTCSLHWVRGSFVLSLNLSV